MREHIKPDLSLLSRSTCVHDLLDFIWYGNYRSNHNQIMDNKKNKVMYLTLSLAVVSLACIITVLSMVRLGKGKRKGECR